MRTVYVVRHVHVADNGDDEDVKFIGVYSSEDAANAAIARLRLQSGFRDHPAGFRVDPYEIDKDHWTEGFISWADAAK